MKRLILALTLLATPASAWDHPWCEPPPRCGTTTCGHDCQCECPPLPPPRPCLDLPLYYYPCDRKLTQVDASYSKPAYLCVIDTVTTERRKVRRTKLINVQDGIVEAATLNGTLCGN